MGDLHFENFGTFKGTTGLVYFDLNEIGEGARLPLAVNLVRFLASIVAAGRAPRLPGTTRRWLLDYTLSQTGDILQGGKPWWAERKTASGAVQSLIVQAASRRRDLVDKLTTDTKGKPRLRTGGKRVLALGDEDMRERIKRAVESNCRERREELEVLDVARRVAGKGSLGRPRFMLLARRAEDRRKLILDLKGAAPSDAAARFGLPQPSFAGEARRIAAIQDRCQAVPPAGLPAGVPDREAYVLRTLQPEEDKIEVVTLGDDPVALGNTFALIGELHAAAILRSAGRQGSADRDEVIAFGTALKADAARWVEVAEVAEGGHRDAFTAFRSAWKEGDRRLTGLTGRGTAH